MQNDQTKLQSALSLAAAGFHVFPLRLHGKTPAFTGWQDLATRDQGTIEEWFRGDAYNIGIYTARFGEGAAVLALDVDNKGDKRGDEEVLRLELDGRDFPATLEQYTPTGGRHLLYLVDEPVKQGANVLGPGLDIRSDGGYVVAAGSTLLTGHYTANGAPIAPAPQWLIDACGRAPERSAPADIDLSQIDQGRAARRAVEYLQTAPPSIQGQGGDQTAYIVACRLKDFGVTQVTAVELLAEHWNPMCCPPWSEDDLADKVKNAYSYGIEAPGAAAPEAQFPPVPRADDVEPVALHPLEAMNREFAYCLDGGGTKGFVLHETSDQDGNPKINYLAMEAFNWLMTNRPFQTGKQTEPISKAWMAWPQRRTYYGVVFAPEKQLGSNFFNLWGGFAVKPAPGDWSKFRDHIFRNICSGNQEHFDYLMKWAARMIQRPADQGCVAIVLRSSEGTGKGIFAHTLRRIAGRHGMHLVNAKHLLGNFNSHLEDKIFVFADECFYAGDKAQEGALKTIITEDKIVVEPKGRTAYQADNRLHIVMATNNDWAVPASASARRFLVLDVNEARQQDTAYFNAIRREMTAGGDEAFMHYLVNLDLSGFDVYDVPKTKALGDQKDRSLRNVPAWLRHVLNSGRVGLAAWSDAGSLVISKSEAHEAYMTWARNGKYRGDENISSITFGRELSKVLKEALRDTRVSTGRRENAYRFAPLVECRAAFDAYMRQPMEWDSPEEMDESGQVF